MTTVREIMRAAVGGGVGSVLVLQDGSLVGIFTERDILRALAAHPMADAARTSSVSKGMTPDPVTIGPDASVGEAVGLVLSRGFRHLPVMENDTAVGFGSLRDLAKSISTA